MTYEPKDRAIAVAELRARGEANTERAKLTAAQRKLLDHSAAIFEEPATRQDAAYLPRELVQVTLPHNNPGTICGNGAGQTETLSAFNRVHRPDNRPELYRLSLRHHPAPVALLGDD